jgi:hypothetical protein
MDGWLDKPVTGFSDACRYFFNVFLYERKGVT